MKTQILSSALALLPLASAVARPEVSAAARLARRNEYVRQVLSSYSSSIDAEATATVIATSTSLTETVVETETATGGESATSTPQGAISTTILAPSIAPLPPGPDAESYPRDGQLHGAQPAPFTPSGGRDTNGSAPVYVPQTDFDFQSISLALYQEWIELDLFRYVLERFSDDEFEAAGLTADDRALISFMADQEVGHAEIFINILGAAAPQPCNYTYPFTTVREFVDFAIKNTRYGESGTYGFLPHLNSGPAASLVQAAIATEARQQNIFRQFGGLFPQPFYFVAGVPQSWHWTLLAPSIASCPANQTRLIWQNFPALEILNNPNATNITYGDLRYGPSISNTFDEPFSQPGREVLLAWERPGKPVGPDVSYVTSSEAGAPAFVAWVSSVNVTYSPLTVLNDTHGTTIQPNATTVGGGPAINGTVFVAITDADVYVTPYNITQINPHVVAGPALYTAG